MRVHSLNEHTCNPETKVQSLEFVMKIQTLESVNCNVALVRFYHSGIPAGLYCICPFGLCCKDTVIK